MDKETQEKQKEKGPVQLKLAEHTLTALLFGEIDHHSAREIREEIDMVLMRVRPQKLVLNFAGVQFMDSSGIGLILGRCKLMQLWQGKVALQDLPLKLEQLVAMAGLDELCEIQTKEEPKNEANQ